MQDHLLDYLPLFQGLPVEQLLKLSQSGQYRNYKNGEFIAGAEEKMRALYFMVWGKVKIFRSLGEGKEQTLYIFGPGEPFCLTLLTDATFPANAVAIEDTRVLILPAAMLEAMAHQEPALVFNILLVMARRLKEALYLVELLSLKSMEQRIASYLLHTAALQASPDVVELSVSQREFAKIVGTTPETLSRMLKGLREKGLIAVHGRIIRILDQTGLAELTVNEAV